MRPERDDGKVEYKLKLVEKDKERLIKLQTQMKYRMEEGNGECIYKLGVGDNGDIKGITDKDYKETLDNLRLISENNNYHINKISTKKIDENKKIYELLIREKNDNKYIDIRVAITGAVDAGKSSLLGYLTTGKLDDGRGSARSNVFNFPHEIKSGRTSSLAHHIMGINENGEIVNHSEMSKISWPEIVKNSCKIISFMDMAGHEKYLKTTIMGVTSFFPDICLIVIGANMGVSKMTREHLFLALTLKIPIIIVLTKMDIVENRQNIYKETLENIKKILKLPGIRHIPYRIKNNDDVILCSEKIYTNSFTPIFEVSNVSGLGMNYLKSFFNYLGNKNKNYNDQKPFEYQIDCMFKNIKGTTIVVGGNVIAGSVKIGDKLLLGPVNNEYINVTIKSIHCKRVPQTHITTQTYACLGLKGIDKEIVRKGHVIVDPKISPKCIYSFDATVQVMKTHSTTVKVGYEPVLQACNVRQTIKLVEIIEKISSKTKENQNDKQYLQIGDKARVRFVFKYRAEYIKPKYKFFLNEGKTKLIGVINNIYSEKIDYF